METLRVERASGEASASPGRSWRGLYRAGGVSAVLFVVLTIVSFVLAFITPQPQSSSGSLMLPGGVATLQYIASNRSVFILDQLLFVGPVVLTMVVFLALYVALKHLSKSYAAIGAVVGIVGVVLSLVPLSLVGGLVYLSDHYVAATTVAQRAGFATAADSLIAQNNIVSAGGILFAVGVLVISLAMLKGVFHKGIAYLGIATGVVGTICEALRPILGPGYSIYLILLAIGVGGSSLIAAFMIFTGREEGVLASVAAGLIMAGYIVVEVVMLRQGTSWTEGLYLGLGLLISGLAAYLWRAEHRGQRLQIRHI